MHEFRDAGEILKKTKIVDRFLRYVRVDSESVEESDKCPSSPGQMELAKMLAKERESRYQRVRDVRTDLDRVDLTAPVPDRPPPAASVAKREKSASLASKKVGRMMV